MTLALGLLAASSPTVAGASLGAVLHVSRGSDTPESLAATYYGNRSRALFIREANRLRSTDKLREGQTLRIPTAYKIKIRRGDTLERLARRFLGDGRRGRFLGEWNGIKGSDPLKVGAELTMPFLLQHTARAPESLSTLARSFYGDPAQGKLLSAYNFRQAPVLARGERLLIPVPHVRVRSVWLASQGTRARSRHARSTSTVSDAEEREQDLARRVAARLRDAEQKWREGSYEDVVDVLSRLLNDEDPSEAQLVAVHRLLGFAYVALGHEEPAVAEFREVLQRDPAADLDPAVVSPKIRAVFDRARDER